jgi:hypothetical protein
MKHYPLNSLIKDKIVSLSENKIYLIFCFDFLFYFWDFYHCPYVFKCKKTWEIIIKSKPTPAVN